MAEPSADRFSGRESDHLAGTRPLDTLNPVRANLQHWSMLARDTINTARWQDKVSLWFRPTGWRPADCLAMDATDPGMQKTGCSDRPKYDPQTTPGKKLYVGCSMMLTFVVCTAFIFLSPQLPAWQVATGTVLVIGGLVIAGDLLENRTRFQWLEWVRVPLLVWFASSLWSTTVLG